MTPGEYLKRPPAPHLLAIIAVALIVHVGLGTILWLVAPWLLWWQAYLISASSGLLAAIALGTFLYRRIS